jgi:uncharacterized protein
VTRCEHADGGWRGARVDQGDRDALYKLAEAHYYEDTGSHRFATAMELLLLLGRAGHAWSQYLLGEAYETGDKVPKDMRRAVQWYGRAAAQGHEFAEAQLELLVESLQGPDGNVVL